MNDNTTIQVSRLTKAKLDRLGVKADTYDDIICRLLEKAGQKRGNKSGDKR